MFALRKLTKVRKELWMVLIMGIVFNACSGGAPSDPNRLILSVTSESTEGTPLEGLEAVVLNVAQIEVIVREVQDDPDTEQRIQLPTEQRPINLLGLADKVSRLIGHYLIEPGFLAQMRFILSETPELIFKPDPSTGISPTFPLKVPSGEQSGIKIVPADGIPIPMVDLQTTFWEIQFDPNHQIIFNKGQGYIMKPVLTAIVLEEKGFSPTVPNQILVTFKDGVTIGEIAALNGTIGATIVGSYMPLNLFLMEFPLALSFEEATTFYELSNLVDQTAPSVIATPAKALVIPNDPNFSNQWALNNIGQTGGTPDADIDAPEAWDLDKGSLNVVIAVLDSGAQLDHPDLVNNLFINAGELPAGIVDDNGDGIITFDDLNAVANAGAVQDVNGNGFLDGEDLIAPVATGGLSDGIDNDGNGFVDDLVGMDFSQLHFGGSETNDVSDDSTGIIESHGTMISGIIGATGGNSQAIAGINHRVRILPIKVCSSDGNCPNLNIRGGIHYAATMGSNIVNISISSTFINRPEGQAAITSFTDFLNNSNDSQGILFVVAAGNDTVDCDKNTVDCWLAEVNLPNLMGVAATTDQDQLASSISNFGVNTIPIAAPGRNILTLDRFGGTTFGFGTSFAAPQVSGVAGLVLSRFPNLVGDPVALRNRLESGADNLSSLDTFVNQGRRLNAHGALQ